jgi:hypothetical protein
VDTHHADELRDIWGDVLAVQCDDLMKIHARACTRDDSLRDARAAMLFALIDTAALLIIEGRRDVRGELVESSQDYLMRRVRDYTAADDAEAAIEAARGAKP